MNPSLMDSGNRLRIAFFVKRFWPDVGGVEKYMYELARALLELGHRVHVIAGDPEGTRPATESHEEIEILRYPSRRSMLRAAWALRRATPVLRRADVIHVSDIEMLERYERFLARRVGAKPLFLTRHGMSLREPVTAEELRRHERARRRVAGMLDDGTFIQRRYGERPDAVPDPGLRPPADELPAAPEPEAARAVFVGRLEPDAGVEIYLDGLRALGERHGIHLPLTVYADGSLRAGFRRRAEALRLDVRWEAPRADAQDRLCDGTLAFVSGRMSIFEAMARRRCVVAAYVDPLKRDYVCGEWFSPLIGKARDGVEAAESVAELLRDPQLRRTRAEAAFQAVRRLNWATTAREYVRVWRAGLARAAVTSSRPVLAWGSP
ncbi:MAG: hypothetical protein FLDDKLPJ_01790 [Phycisphaerae bacterium]|nr:hypothetical protein [Phycisphaerae bacterium]